MMIIAQVQAAATVGFAPIYKIFDYYRFGGYGLGIGLNESYFCLKFYKELNKMENRLTYGNMINPLYTVLFSSLKNHLGVRRWLL